MTSEKSGRPASYKDAGVDVEAGNALVSRIREIAAKTHGPAVLGGIGGFASLMRLPEGLSEPLLVSSCDGVGTKVKVAFATGRHDTVGIDLVAMNVNDLICCGAAPLFFLDYIGTGRLDLDVTEAVVSGVAEGCSRARCALVGGETAEMPDLYASGEYDLAGFTVGVVDRARLLDGAAARAGDTVVGLAASGLHSNGYSLARRVLIESDTDLDAVVPELGRSLADELLEPTTIYVDAIGQLRQRVDVKALAHITGGGLVDNPPRCVSADLAFRLDPRSWKVPAVMSLIAQRSGIELGEMRRTFNMGLGMLAVVAAADADAALDALSGCGARIVGEIVARSGPSVEFVGE